MLKSVLPYCVVMDTWTHTLNTRAFSPPVISVKTVKQKPYIYSHNNTPPTCLPGLLLVHTRKSEECVLLIYLACHDTNEVFTRCCMLLKYCMYLCTYHIIRRITHSGSLV